MVLVGTEIASADKNTNSSELSDWLKGVFNAQDIANIVYLNLHEYVHTQQKDGGRILLDQCIQEGAADFIAELATSKKISTNYLTYGREHEPELKEKFKTDMFGSSTYNWLYNGTNVSHADLGYFMGYEICKSYYEHSPNKNQAIKDIIELNYADEQQVISFLDKSKYYDGTINKQELSAKYEARRPYVSGLYPDELKLHTAVPYSLTEMTILFSEPMGKGTSISLGKGGKEHFPLSDIVGFSEDRRSIKLKLSLKPDTEYDFLITGKGFMSQTGYPLKEYVVSFKTKP